MIRTVPISTPYIPGEHETRAVLAGAYLTRSRAGLTHTIDLRHSAPLVLCRRVAVDSLADPYAQDRNAAPTCPVCLRKDPRFGGAS